MYYINKIVWFCISPFNIGLALIFISWFMLWRQNRHRSLKLSLTIFIIAIAWLIIWSLPITAYLLGHGIERRFVEKEKFDAPKADVAIDFGGSLVRSWYASEVYKCGKVNAVIPSAEKIEDVDVPLIRDLGVFEADIWIENNARNTEENVKYSREKCLEMTGNTKVTVLVVSSAVHIPRCMLMMAKYWPEAKAIACPCDFQTTRTFEDGWKWTLLVPSLSSYLASESFLHEYIGYFGYKYFRK